MEKAFSNFTWRNTPSTDTPINQLNLNKINNGLNTVDDRVITLDATKANLQDMLTDVVNIAYNTTTGVWTFTRRNGTTFTVDQNVEKIPVSFSMSAQGVITMTTADGTEYTADISTLIKQYTFMDTSVIDFTTTTDASGNIIVTATIKAGSITDSMLETNYLANITVQAQNAAASAGDALLSAQNAAADALLAQSYAIGTGGARSDEATDNSKYYKEQASSYSTTSQTYSLVSEGYSLGSLNGVPVPSTSVYYHNNAKYFAELAASYVGAVAITQAQWDAIELLI